MESLTTILTDEKFWVVIAAAAGAIAAIAALFTVYHSRTSWDAEREAKRPYFIVEKPGIKPLPDSPPFRIQITMENRGVHPASDMEGRILILNSELNNQPDFDFNFSLANAIPPNSPTPWYNDSVHLPSELAPQFVVMAIKYKDPILRKDFAQVYFMRWDGIKNGSTHPDFVYASKEDAAKITQYIGEALDDFSTKYSL